MKQISRNKKNSKRKPQFFRFALALRMTIYFMVFGLMIGYLTTIINTVMATKGLMKSMSEKFDAEFDTFSNIDFENQNDVFLEIFNSQSEDSYKVIKAFETLAARFDMVVHPRIYYKNRETNSWQLLYNSFAKKDDAPLAGINQDMEKTLDNALDEDVSHQGIPFFGQQDREHILFDITRPQDNNQYVLWLDHDRVGLLRMIEKNKESLGVFTLIILILSFLLGQGFSRKVVKPVRKLTRQAQRIADGDYQYRTKIRGRDDIASLAYSINIMADNIQEHWKEIQHRMSTMETMNKIDKSVLSPISRKGLMKQILKIVKAQFKDSHIVISYQGKNDFEILSDFDENNQHNHSFNISDDLKKKLSKSFYVLSRNDKEFPSELAFLPEQMLPLLNQPIVIEDKFQGTVFFSRPGGYDTSDREAAQMLVDQIGVALQSVKNTEEREELFLGALLALAKSVDTKSKWTAGHSERVAEYAVSLAEELNLSEENIKQVRLAAILHDIGKIGVNEQILDKPGKLTEEEFAEIKTHPEKGAAILENIPGIDAIIDAVLFHHEKWDGQGYPKGLAGEDIPFLARIITVADVYEAITDDRPYRAGMEFEEAVDFMEKQRAKIFDPYLAKVFIDFVRAQQQKMAG